MAYGAEPTRADALSPFIYVWPSRELISRSWSWSAWWHEAFQDAAGRIALAVAIYNLDGRRFTRRLVALQLSVGTVRFRVKRRGTSIFVTVAEFAASRPQGPDGPDGTRRQPGAVDGLVLGLHGTDRGYYLVVFHGHMPPVPAATSLAKGKSHLTSIRPAEPQRHGTDERMPAGAGRLGARLGCEFVREQESAQAAGAMKGAGRVKGGSQIRIVKTGTVTLGAGARRPGSQSAPTSDGGIRLHWTLFWCTIDGSIRATPIFRSHALSDARSDRTLQLEKVLFEPASSRYLH